MSQKQQDTYTPSPQMADKLKANRDGKLTDSQRAPIVAAALISGIGLAIVTLMAAFMTWGFVQTITFTGIVGIIFGTFSLLSFLFLIIVLWTNAEMFVPEAIARNPVRHTRGKLKWKKASRERPELPYTCIIGDYSFMPLVAPREIPLEKDREYVVYYTAKSRLLLSMIPTDTKGIAEYLPAD